MEEKKENFINTDDTDNKINEINVLPEPEISENEMKEIIDFINNWDYEKYERDSEVREALLLLRSKMKQEEKEKEQKLEELRIKENNEAVNKINGGEMKEEEIKEDIYIEDKSNNNKNNVELSEQEKEILEKNWNSSTKPEYGEKIVNEKGDKEIIIDNEKKNKKVINIIYNNIFFFQKNKKKYKSINDLVYTNSSVVPNTSKNIFLNFILFQILTKFLLHMMMILML